MKLKICKDRCTELMDIICKIQKVEFIPAKSRLSWVVWTKIIVSSQLRKEGYGYREIGECLGMDHSTILFYCRKLESALESPIFYKKELSLYNKFINIVNAKKEDERAQRNQNHV